MSEVPKAIPHIAIITTLIYLASVLAVRIAGARSLAKMSAYDTIVTIALGSLAAGSMLAETGKVAYGFTAMAMMLVWQRVLSILFRRAECLRRVGMSSPALVLWEGRMLEDKMERMKLTDAEVRAAVRLSGLAAVEDALAVVLENDGSWSVIRKGDHSSLSALTDTGIPGLSRDAA